MGHSQPRRLEERIAHECWLALVLLALVLGQVALLPRPLGVALNPLLLLVICQTLISGPASAARWAFYGGLSLDICADSALGSHALAMLAAVLLAALVLTRLSPDNWLLPLIGSVFGALTYYAVLGLITTVLVAPLDPQAYLLVAMVPGVLTVLIPSLPVFLIMRWLEARRRGEVPIDVY